MKAFKILGLSLFGFLLFSACKNEVLPSELVGYVANPENGLHKIKTVGDLKVDLQYKPLAYMISNELRKNDIPQSAFQQRASELDGLQYYNLKLSVDQPGKDITNYEVYDDAAQQNRLYYLSFGMKQDISLVQGQDTLKPVLYHFERSFNLTKHRTFVVAFKEHDLEHQLDKTFVLESPELGTGPIKLKIQKDDLQNTPSLKLL